jgi:hypothetical protein
MRKLNILLKLAVNIIQLIQGCVQKQALVSVLLNIQIFFPHIQLVKGEYTYLIFVVAPLC